RVLSHAGAKLQTALTCGPVGAVDGEPTATQFGFRADVGTVARNDGLVVVPPRRGASGGYAACTFRLDELHATGIRKTFFRRVNDLHDVTMRAAGRKLLDRAAHLANRRPETG